MIDRIPSAVEKCSLFVAFTFLSLLSACGPNAPATPASPPLPAVTVARPIAKEVVEWDEYTGRLEAVETVEVRARVSGYLTKINFKDGAKVKKGDLLYVIDPRQYQAEVDRTMAEVTRLEARLELAKNDLARAERLIKTRAISEQDYDTRSKGVSAAGAELRSAKAALETAKLNLEFTQLRAPINGRISRTLKTVGNLVNGGNNSGDATLLTTIVSTDPIYVYIDADEQAVLKYRRLSREGLRESARHGPIPMELELADEKNFPHKGVTDFVEPRLDPTTGTVRARGVFSNENDQLSPGFFVRVRIHGSGTYPALLISDVAIGVDQEKKFVLVVNSDDMVEYRVVKPGPIVEGLRVIQEGLKPDDWIIVNGLQRVQPGLKVSPEKIDMASLAKGPDSNAAAPGNEKSQPQKKEDGAH
ncbi:MAG TPA: efflux RND transporter periplasmic adaptor subunit [Burkholderiales bacterium]